MAWRVLVAQNPPRNWLLVDRIQLEGALCHAFTCFGKWSEQEGCACAKKLGFLFDMV
jgi:hypothetical protein